MTISPIPQNNEQVFSSAIYNLDFYKKLYMRKGDTGKRLIDDIFYNLVRIIKYRSINNWSKFIWSGL